jgi:hypothetical protein
MRRLGRASARSQLYVLGPTAVCCARGLAGQPCVAGPLRNGTIAAAALPHLATELAGGHPAKAGVQAAEPDQTAGDAAARAAGLCHRPTRLTGHRSDHRTVRPGSGAARRLVGAASFIHPPAGDVARVLAGAVATDAGDAGLTHSVAARFAILATLPLDAAAPTVACVANATILPRTSAARRWSAAVVGTVRAPVGGPGSARAGDGATGDPISQRRDIRLRGARHPPRRRHLSRGHPLVQARHLRRALNGVARPRGTHRAGECFEIEDEGQRRSQHRGRLMAEGAVGGQDHVGRGADLLTLGRRGCRSAAVRGAGPRCPPARPARPRIAGSAPCPADRRPDRRGVGRAASTGGDGPARHGRRLAEPARRLWVQLLLQETTGDQPTTADQRRQDRRAHARTPLRQNAPLRVATTPDGIGCTSSP